MLGSPWFIFQKFVHLLFVHYSFFLSFPKVKDGGMWRSTLIYTSFIDITVKIHNICSKDMMFNTGHVYILHMIASWKLYYVIAHWISFQELFLNLRMVKVCKSYTSLSVYHYVPVDRTEQIQHGTFSERENGRVSSSWRENCATACPCKGIGRWIEGKCMDVHVNSVQNVLTD